MTAATYHHVSILHCAPESANGGGSPTTLKRGLMKFPLTRTLPALAVAMVFSLSAHVDANETLSKCELKAASNVHTNYGSLDRKEALSDAREQEKFSRAELTCENDPNSDGAGDALDAVQGYAYAAIEYWRTNHIADARRVSALGAAILRRVAPRTDQQRRLIGDNLKMFACASHDNCVGWGPKAQ